jgi:serine/threonine protein kinase
MSERPTGVAGRFVGGYRVLQKIGEGGMGVVYEAEQQNPRRSVALKVIRGGGYQDDTQVRLFEREVQALARLKHPGIAAIYESGRTEEGQHFFAMELVTGSTVGAYIHRVLPSRPPSAAEIKRVVVLFVKICDAIAYAHQRGVIHRDLKPSNIFVSHGEHGGPGSGDVIPEIKVLDFGLARITEADNFAGTVFTEVGTIHGTVPYMSPEQFSLDRDQIDLRTDVYSLGVMLYELITGELPYNARGVSPYEAARIICEETPGGSAVFTKSIDSDLRAIVLKALEKSPDNRYQTVSALGDDLSRYLNDLPVLAKPPRATYQAYKLIRRHRAAAAAAATIVLLLAILAVVMTVQARRLALERDRANREAETSKQISDFMTGLFNVSDPREARGNTITAREILDRGARTISSDLSEQPLVQAQLMTVMGRVYAALGLFDSSSALLDQALSIRRANLEPLHPDLADSLNLAGRTLRDKGDYAGSEELIRNGLMMRRQLFGEKHVAVAESVNDLGTVIFATGNYADAEPLFRDALAMRRELLGEADERTVESLNDLAMTIEYLRADYPTAIKMLGEVLKHRRAQWGTDHPAVSQALNNLGMAHYRSRHYETAEPLFRDALAMNRRLFGDKHPEVSANLHNLALLLNGKGDYGGAELLFMDALELERTLHGAEHPDTAQTLISLAAARADGGKYAAAEATYREALSIQRKMFADTDYQIATTKGLLGAALTGARRYAEAESLLLSAYSVIAERFGDPHPRTQAMLKRIVNLYAAWGKPQEADRFKSRIR